jgi:ubiquinone/menaquinone biosynthesis C-methylase UbiE
MSKSETSSTQGNSLPGPTYFELEAYVGTTKHMGGLATTDELVRLCHIDKDAYVLDVGCGVGATACYLAKTIGCNVVGVDLRESMIARAHERLARENLAEKVEFKVADALDLPFEDAHFDAVFSESVATFVEDKQRVANEYARVAKPGGYVGFNEEIWLKAPPPGLDEDIRIVWEIESGLPTAEGWRALLEGAGLHDITVQTYEFDARREATQIKRYRLADMWKMTYRTLVLYLKSSEFREYMKERRRIPKNIFEYLGYGLFVGRKSLGG